LHAALEGALPRSDPEDQRLFSLLKRAYIEGAVFEELQA